MKQDPQEFAAAWAAHWNDHDVEALLAHFDDEVLFTSPVARRVIPGSTGVIRGKAALRAYWTRGLELIPDLRFSVVDVYGGLETIVINYRNQVDNLVCEVLTFRDDLVVEGHGTYLSNSTNPAGAR